MQRAIKGYYWKAPVWEMQNVSPEERFRLAHPLTHMVLLLTGLGAIQGAIFGAIGGVAWAVLTGNSALLCLVITVMVAVFGAAVGGTVVGAFGALCAVCEWYGNRRDVEESGFPDRGALVKHEPDQRFLVRGAIQRCARPPFKYMEQTRVIE
jgi:hypothetical protein